MTLSLVSACGASIPLPVHRWRAPATPVERRLLAGLPEPVLDVGCGPGRLVAELTAGGRTALGIDPSPAAIAESTARGVPALRRSVFGPLPGEGRWGSVLLVDGNIGIGGDPVVLLRRVRDLLAPGGTVVAEVEPPGQATRTLQVRLHTPGADATGPWFPWATVSADDVASLTLSAGLVLIALEPHGGRWFASAHRP